MRSGVMRIFFVFLIAFVHQSVDLRAELLRIGGASSVNIPVAAAAQVLRAEANMDIQITTSGGSNAGIVAVGERQAEIGMISRELVMEDRVEFPDIDFQTIDLGRQVIALVVSRDVWEGGVRSLSVEQARGIYTKKFTNWKDLGGPDQKITFFSADEGRGTWELFAAWVFGSTQRAPLGRFPVSMSDKEARNSVEFTPGAISFMAPKWADGRSTFVLPIKADDGKVLEPVPATVKAGSYPMVRPLYLITPGRPVGNALRMIELLQSERGQQIIRDAGYMPAGDMAKAKP